VSGPIANLVHHKAGEDVGVMTRRTRPHRGRSVPAKNPTQGAGLTTAHRSSRPIACQQLLRALRQEAAHFPALALLTRDHHMVIGRRLMPHPRNRRSLGTLFDRNPLSSGHGPAPHRHRRTSGHPHPPGRNRVLPRPPRPLGRHHSSSTPAAPALRHRDHGAHRATLAGRQRVDPR
jgi:hypothetical protein